MRAKSIMIDADADSAYCNLRGNPITRTDEIADGIIVDYGADGRPVGIEVLSVSRRVGTGDARSYLNGLADGLMLASPGGAGSWLAPAEFSL